MKNASQKTQQQERKEKGVASSLQFSKTFSSGQCKPIVHTPTRLSISTSLNFRLPSAHFISLFSAETFLSEASEPVRNLPETMQMLINNATSSFQNEENDRSTNTYLYIYAAIALLNTVFTLIRAFLFAVGGVVAARRMHKQLLDSILTVSFRYKLNF